MVAGTSTTPLIAIDAVVLDTETTGLDPHNARIVEVAAVRLAGGRLDTAASFRRLVAPGEPVPAASAAIHGIDDAALADAPAFGAIWPELLAFIGDAVVIGHTIGFDLAVLRGECRRAGLDWPRLRILDTRLLAQVVQPNLAGFSLESLASWLGVEAEPRHAALGDALTTARIFAALVPKLRDRNIRTLAEAETACRALTDVLEAQHRAGFIEPVAAPERERGLGRIDSYPYRHRVRELMTSPPLVIAPETRLVDALHRMIAARVSSVFVQTPESPGDAASTGIVTERDVLRAIDSVGAAALDRPVSEVMTRPLAVVPADAFAYRAAGRMGRLHVRHLGVVDEDGRVVGALSARDLLRLRAQQAVALGDAVDDAADVHQLCRAWARLPRTAAALLEEGVSGREVAAVISRELGAATRRAAVLAERRMEEAGQGKPPCPYGLAVLGSAGRGESLLAMDQDNALVFAEGEPDGPADRWFETFARHVSDILDTVGVPYCRGGVMASNPLWRGSLATWRARIDDWVRRSRPQDLLSVDIFFDWRTVSGDSDLSHAVRRHSFEAVRGEAGFAKLLAEAAGPMEPGLTFFGGLRTDNGRIDLKRAGLFGIVSAARVLAVHYGITARSTPERLAALQAREIGGGADLAALDEAHAVFVDLILRQQVVDMEQGLPPSNRVAVRRMSQADRRRLRLALERVRHIEALTQDLLFQA